MAPQAVKSVLPVEDSFSNKEMRTFCRIRAHQSTSKTINASLWWVNKASFYQLLRRLVLVRNKPCGAFPLANFCSVLRNIMA